MDGGGRTAAATAATAAATPHPPHQRSVTPQTSVIGAGSAPRQPPPGRLPNSGMTNLFLRRP